MGRERRIAGRDAPLSLRPRTPTGPTETLPTGSLTRSYRVLAARRGNHCSSRLRCDSAVSQRARATLSAPASLSRRIVGEPRTSSRLFRAQNSYCHENTMIFSIHPDFCTHKRARRSTCPILRWDMERSGMPRVADLHCFPYYSFIDLFRFYILQSSL
jgi:hypothetical protein